MKIGRDIRSFRRFWFILETIAGYGFFEIAGQIEHIRLSRRYKASTLAGKTRAQKICMLFEELGPTFVKLGQILSTRPDLVGRGYADALKKLTEHVSPFPYEQVEEILRKELGRDPSLVFSQIDRKPLAAASIGQVHTATLRRNGMQVVVKIQRPHIEAVIEQDLAIMLYMARKLQEHNSALARHQPVRIVEEFAYSLRRELNYQIEAANLLRFARNAQGNRTLKVPEIYPEYSSRHVLVQERIIGHSAATVLNSPELMKKFDLKATAKNGVNAFFTQIFIDGFFHADPHPGNIFLLDDGRICFIDFGMMGRIGQQERNDFARCLKYVLREDIPNLTDAALRMTITGKFTGSREELERDIADLVDMHINLPLERLSLAAILDQLLALLDRYELALKPNLYMMFKALMTLENIGRTLDPELKIVEMIKPFLLRLQLRKLNPRRSLLPALENLAADLGLLERLPRQCARLAELAGNGEFQIPIEHRGLDDIEGTIYVTGERLSRSMLLTALVLGTSLMIVAKMPPLVNGVPIVGTLGFAGTAIMSLLVLWDDHRHRRRYLLERERRKAQRLLNKK